MPKEKITHITQDVDPEAVRELLDKGAENFTQRPAPQTVKHHNYGLEQEKRLDQLRSLDTDES